MHIEFTQADESHIESLVSLVNRSYRGEESKKGWTTEAHFLDGQRIDADQITEMINQEDSVILVAENDDDGELLGCVHLQKQDLTCYLGMLTVQPTLQKRGIGKMLLEESEALAQFWDCTSIYMTVISKRKEVISWYEKQGFHNTEQKKPFPYGDERFGIPKMEGLEFVILKKNIT